ncbi:hypothetical protein RsTz2092_04680 [Deferribacterales bacterium RsTz2092]|nr:hypothetical protein AGMMS49941_02690 [Deferribacterales bacterium]
MFFGAMKSNFRRTLKSLLYVLSFIFLTTNAAFAVDYTMGYITGMTTLKFGADTAVENGLHNISSVVSGERSLFVGMGGDSVRYDIGSHINVWGYAVVAGTAHRQTFEHGELVLGDFLEYGMAAFESFENPIPTLKDRGYTNYVGAGTMGHFKASNNMSAEASVRFGKVKTHYNINDSTPSYYDNTSSLYLATHLGIGYQLKLGEGFTIGAFAKQFWTMQVGDSIDNESGDRIEFQNIVSAITRVGLQASFPMSDIMGASIRLAYDYESNGKVRATSNGNNIDIPSQIGGTYMAGFGFDIKPKELPISTSFDVDMATGMREGAVIGVQFTYNFQPKGAIPASAGETAPDVEIPTSADKTKVKPAKPETAE